jgi:hypothetical protein
VKSGRRRGWAGDVRAEEDGSTMSRQRGSQSGGGQASVTRAGKRVGQCQGQGTSRGGCQRQKQPGGRRSPASAGGAVLRKEVGEASSSALGGGRGGVATDLARRALLEEREIVWARGTGHRCAGLSLLTFVGPR